jgi:secreted trypsin-like serine protease
MSVAFVRHVYCKASFQESQWVVAAAEAGAMQGGSSLNTTEGVGDMESFGSVAVMTAWRNWVNVCIIYKSYHNDVAAICE